MRALRVAAVIHALHGALATVLGLAGIANGLIEGQIPTSDWQMFIAMALLGPILGVWLLLVVRNASGPRARAWTLPRAIVAVVLLVVYGVVAAGSVSLAAVGGVGAGFLVAVAIGMAWLAVPEVLVLLGTISVVRATSPSRS